MVDYSSDIRACVDTLHRGGMILYPTDTVWGIGCDATNEAAVERIFSLKKRQKEKSLIVLLATAREVLKYVTAPPPDIIDLIESFAEPTTIIFQNAIHLAENATAEDGSIAIRVPDDLFCKALLRRFRKPLISTSANQSGERTPRSFAEIHSSIIEAVDFVVKYRQDDTSICQPSRIVRFADDGRLVDVRS